MTAAATQRRPAYLHRAGSRDLSAAGRERQPRQRQRRRRGMPSNVVADLLLEAGESLYEARYEGRYGALRGPLAGVAGPKTTEERIHMIVVALTQILNEVKPPGAVWDVDLQTLEGGAPECLILSRDGQRQITRVRIEGASLIIGVGVTSVSMPLAGRQAGYAAMKAFAAVLGRLFGAPQRAVVA